jgi:hypothetical protein
MKDNKYNGWANYATWRINLEMFDGFEVTEHFTGRPEVNELADHLKETAESYLEETAGDSASLCLSYALAFLSDVDWEEIAESKMEDAEFEKYSVVVGNVGEVYSGYSEEHAEYAFDLYREFSNAEFGRPSGEFVTMFLAGEIVKEHIPIHEGEEK